MRFIVIFCLFISSVCMADLVSPVDNFDSAEEITEGNTKTFVGKPAIVVEKNTHHEVEVNPSTLLPPPQLKRPNLTITTPYGHQRHAAFIDHTTDFSIIVQVLDDKTVHVQEVIQFVSTQDSMPFKRVYPNKNVKILTLSENNKNIPYTITEGALQTTQPLSSGFHRITVSYVMDYSLLKDNAISELSIPLMGLNWPLMTERFSVVLLLPQKGDIYTNELLFGSNNQTIPEDVLIQKDAAGAITYQLTHPLPAFADVKLHLRLDSKSIPESKMELTPNMILMLIYGAVILAYTLFSIITARRKKYTYTLKMVKKINPILWYLALGRNLSALKLKTKIASQPPLKIIAFVRFNYEYMIGLGLLITLTELFSYYAAIQLSQWVIVIMAIIALTLIHIFGTKVDLSHLLNKFRHILTQTPQGINLPLRDIHTYYTIACIFGFGAMWEQQLKKQNPTYITHLKQEEKS